MDHGGISVGGFRVIRSPLNDGDGRSDKRHRAALRTGRGAVPHPRWPAARSSRPRWATFWAIPAPRGGSGATRSTMGPRLPAYPARSPRRPQIARGCRRCRVRVCSGSVTIESRWKLGSHVSAGWAPHQDLGTCLQPSRSVRADNGITSSPIWLRGSKSACRRR